MTKVYLQPETKNNLGEKETIQNLKKNKTVLMINDKTVCYVIIRIW